MHFETGNENTQTLENHMIDHQEFCELCFPSKNYLERDLTNIY